MMNPREHFKWMTFVSLFLWLLLILLFIHIHNLPESVDRFKVKVDRNGIEIVDPPLGPMLHDKNTLAVPEDILTPGKVEWLPDPNKKLTLGKDNVMVNNITISPDAKYYVDTTYGFMDLVSKNGEILANI